MTLLDEGSIFTSMLQGGPFSVNDDPPSLQLFSKESRRWVESLHCDQLLKTKYRAVRNQIFDFLGVSGFDEVSLFLHDQQRREMAGRRASKLLANMFGLECLQQDVGRYLYDYATTADDVVNSLRAKVLAPYSSHIETSNEIETTHNPVDLLLIYFTPRFHKKARFEAKRKLVLMNLAGSIDQRERETDIATKFSEFIIFLNMHVWSPSLKIGDLAINYLHSRHHPADFRCEKVEVLSEEEAARKKPVVGEKLTLVKRRSFLYNGREIPIYVTIRKKPPAAKVLKLLRKNEKNPATAVDDELGLMAVLNSVAEVKMFVRHLTQSALKADSFMTLEDISDTLTGGDYSSNSTGSSGKTPMLKFFARLGGMRVEFIIHTNRSYLNYMYQRDVAHDEYEVKRIFDAGVAEFLFPQDIYSLDMDDIRSSQLERFRRRIEEW